MESNSVNLPSLVNKIGTSIISSPYSTSKLSNNFRIQTETIQSFRFIKHSLPYKFFLIQLLTVLYRDVFDYYDNKKYKKIFLVYFWKKLMN